MPLIKIPYIDNYDAVKSCRTIYPDYKCNCTKAWKGDELFIVYKMTKNGIEKIHESSEGDYDKNVNLTLSYIGSNVTAKLIVSGGHTVLNLKDRFFVSDEVLKSVNFSFKLIAGLQQKFNKKAEFLVLLNDFFMEKDAGTDIGLENKYRKESLNPFVIPPKINDFLVSYSKLLDRKIDLHFCSEKNMADRFKRHIQNYKKDDSNTLFSKDPVTNNWYMNAGNKKFSVLMNDKPNCVAGCAATFRAIRYEISSNKIKDNFTSYVGIFPLCCLENTLNGYLAANAFYDHFDLPGYLMFFGRCCF